MTTFGELLDLIDNSRESDELVSIMDCNGTAEVTAPVRSSFWSPFENRTVNSIEADRDGGMLNVWLD